MPRGRHYYDPVIQVPGTVEGAEDLSRIELFPEGAPDDPNPRWVARRIRADGTIDGVSNGDFDHDRALAQAQQMWPDLTVYELRSEGEDSTWEGHGPSPRLWQNPGGQPPEKVREMAKVYSDALEKNSSPETGTVGALPPDSVGPSLVSGEAGAGDEHIPPAVGERAQILGIRIEQPGDYVLMADIMDYVCTQLEMWAVAYEVDKNPSAAMALREAVDTLKDVG